MPCSNCFNGCADIVSDQCVKYTGIPIPGLGIATGDSLLVVENQIISKILTLITGEGIIPIIDPDDLCSIVSDFLPTDGEITLNHVISALFRTVCNLDTRLTIAEDKLVTLDADYVIECLSGVAVNSGTHAILQATISQLCAIEAEVALLTANLETNYVLVSDIDDFIASYIAGIPVSSLYNSRMIPYTAVPYFGSLTGNFDATGAGLGLWLNIYLCNGQNLTPDLRGRVLVGTTTMGPPPYSSSAVDPSIAGNPSYAQSDLVGANLAKLTSVDQLPPHSHTASVTINDPTHLHKGHVIKATGTWSGGGSDSGDNATSITGNTNASLTGLKGTGAGQNVFVTNSTEGLSAGHNNIQPVYASNFIIYIP